MLTNALRRDEADSLSAEEELIQRRVARDELCRVQVPALIDAVDERVLRVAIGEPPRVVHDGFVLGDLRGFSASCPARRDAAERA